MIDIQTHVTASDDTATGDEACTRALVEIAQSFAEAIMEIVTGLKSGRLELDDETEVSA